MEVSVDSDIDDIGRLDDSDIDEKIFSAIYAINARAPRGRNQGQGKGENPKYKKKTFPIQCGKEHSNGSAYFSRFSEIS